VYLSGSASHWLSVGVSWNLINSRRLADTGRRQRRMLYGFGMPVSLISQAGGGHLSSRGVDLGPQLHRPGASGNTRTAEVFDT
jgi:hypothetical protein